MAISWNRDRTAELAGALANPVRVGVLILLCSGPKVVHELTEELKTEPSSLSKHLSILKSSGLIQCDPEWRCRRYSLKDPEAVRSILDALAKLQGDAK